MSLSPISTANTGLLTISSSRTRAQTPVPETGYAARVAQLGPTLGTVVATGELVSDAAKATYTMATQKLHQLGNAAALTLDTTAAALSDLGNAASDALHSAEQSIEDAASSTVDTVSSAAKAMADAFDTGVQTVGQWIDEAV
jgi:fructose-1-phosphate kinase PfkB-like protein